MNQSKLILVTGATGYIGARLVPRLLQAGYRVRCMVRDASRLQGRSWTDEIEVVEGDPSRPETLSAAMEGVWATYYLIHSLTDTREYRERDMAVARTFAHAAKASGVARIIYLGGLGDPDTELSVHLRSRPKTLLRSLTLCYIVPYGLKNPAPGQIHHTRNNMHVPFFSILGHVPDLKLGHASIQNRPHTSLYFIRALERVDIREAETAELLS